MKPSLLAEIDVAIEKGTVNTPDETGKTLLHTAVMRLNTAAVEKLLSHPATHIDSLDNDKNTPLHLLAQSSIRTEESIATTNNILFLLFEKHKPNLGIKNQEGKTAMDVAIQTQNSVVGNFLSEKSSSLGYRTVLTKKELSSIEKDLEGPTKEEEEKQQKLEKEAEEKRNQERQAIEERLQKLREREQQKDLDKTEKITSDTINKRDIKGRTVLHNAVVNENSSDVEKFTESLKADKNLADNNGNTPLHLFAQLKLSGADSEAITLFKKATESYKEAQIEFHNAEAIYKKAVTQHKTDMQQYGNALKELQPNNESSKQVIEDFKKQADEKFNTARTVFDKARTNYQKAKMGYQTAVETYQAAIENNAGKICNLIVTKSNLKLENDLGRTPLNAAAVTGNTFVVNFLLTEDSSLHKTKDTAGETPLHHATKCKDEKIAGILIDKGADVNVKDNERKTPLHNAVASGQVTTVKLLASKGSKANNQDKDGNTPVHVLAAVSKKEDAYSVKQMFMDIYFVDRKTGTKNKTCDLTLKNNDGLAPIHIAAKTGNKEMIELLVSADKGQLQLKDSKGLTALDRAIQAKQTDLIAYLRERKAPYTLTAELLEIVKIPLNTIIISLLEKHEELVKQSLLDYQQTPKTSSFSGQKQTLAKSEPGLISMQGLLSQELKESLQTLQTKMKENKYTGLSDEMKTLEKAAKESVEIDQLLESYKKDYVPLAKTISVSLEHISSSQQ